MSLKRVLSHDPLTGITEIFESTEDGFNVHSVQDVEPILEANKARANTPDAWRGDFRKEASIPMTLLLKWATEDGVPPGMVFSPEYAAKVARRLNDPDYRHLKCANVRI